MAKKKAVIAVAKPKTKKVKVKVKEETPIEISVETSNIGSATTTSGTLEPPEKIFFDGRYVSEILGDANEKENLCLMSDGTKTLVPKDLFLKEQ